LRIKNRKLVAVWKVSLPSGKQLLTGVSNASNRYGYWII
jgi:hypothetical protein